MRFLKSVLLSAVSLCLIYQAGGEVVFPGSAPGMAHVSRKGEVWELTNDLLKAKYSLRDGKLSFDGLAMQHDLLVESGGELFVISTADGKVIKSSELKCAEVKLVKLKAEPKAPRKSEQLPGKALVASFSVLDGALKMEWKAVLRDGSHYLRQELVLRSTRPVSMSGITGMQYKLEKGTPSLAGKVRGSVVVTDRMFAALETPMGLNTVEPGNMAQGVWSRKTELKPGDVWEVSSVIGLVAPDQLRRSFLAYLERERAVPYHPFVHYNSWYELGVDRTNSPDPEKRMTEKQCLGVVRQWKTNLYDKRGVSLDAFVWDDGWDDFNSLWAFHKMFPQGFKKVDEEARLQKAGIGAWLGPVGGYHQSKELRLAYWNKNHPRNKVSNFQLSNKEYFDAFVGRCSQMVKDYNMKYFKFDGISTDVNARGPVNEEDAEGIINIVTALRKGRGDLFVNCTVGSWPSPFWYRYVDSLWRQQGDWGLAGAGNNREKFMTYRDKIVHDIFAKGSFLMPINSLMTHGMILTKFGPPSAMPRDTETMIKDIRSSLASGTNLQEFYVDADLMNAAGDVLWDEVARGTKWIRRNADVLDDVHWVGGSPGAGEIYGWAAWNPGKATFALRNPAAEEKTLEVTLRQALDIPATVKGKITMKDSYGDQRVLPGFSGASVDIDVPVKFTLKSFEVLVYEAGEVNPAMAAPVTWALSSGLESSLKTGAKGKISDAEYALILKLEAGVSTRADFLKFFQPCGLTSAAEGGYRYIKCLSVGIDVTFSSKKDSDGRAIAGMDDKILKISKPYWQPTFLMD